eukprot:scaffold680523_cov57-Prasinocladus_malaysianus.AAC.1
MAPSYSYRLPLLRTCAACHCHDLVQFAAARYSCSLPLFVGRLYPYNSVFPMLFASRADMRQHQLLFEVDPLKPMYLRLNKKFMKLFEYLHQYIHVRRHHNE